MATDPFKYIPPDPSRHEDFETIASTLAIAYRAIINHCPESRERSLAVTKLQEARMWANAAISFQGQEIIQ